MCEDAEQNGVKRVDESKITGDSEYHIKEFDYISAVMGTHGVNLIQGKIKTVFKRIPLTVLGGMD